MRLRHLVLLALAIRGISAQATVTGIVFDSLRTRTELTHATVVIPEIGRYATTDSRGRFRFDSVPAGQYSITFLHAELDSLDMAAPSIPLAVPTLGAIKTRLATPAPSTVYGRFCPGPHDLATGFYLGRIVDVDNAAPLSHAIVTAAWTDFVFERGRMTAQPVRVEAVSNDAGVYILCGVPQDLSLEISAVAEGFDAGPVRVALDSLLIGRANMSISRRDPGARTAVASVSDTSSGNRAARAGSATISGTVHGDGDRPLSGATAALHGAPVSARTDAHGRFRLTSIPAGTRAIDIRAIGTAPAAFTANLATGAVFDTLVRLDRIQQLRAVAVVERAATIDKTGFKERAHQGMGRYLTREDIDRLPTANVATLITRVGGIFQMGKFLRMHGGRHSNGSTLTNSVDMCFPAIFVDGQQYMLDYGSDPYVTLKWMAPVEDVMGIEVYRANEPIPAFADHSSFTGCGSVIIWTNATIRH